MKIQVNNYDITPTVGGLSWQSGLDNLAVTLSFEVPKIGAQYTTVYHPSEGDFVRMSNDGGAIFEGMVLSVGDGDRFVNAYTAVDFGWWLNKSSGVYQFSGATLRQVLEVLRRDNYFEIASLCEMPLTFSKIYLRQTPSEVLDDMLQTAMEQTGYEYNYDFTPDGMRVYRLGDNHSAPSFRLSPNTRLVDSVSMRGGTAHSRSIEDMKNSVVVVSGNEEAYKILATARDDELIDKYGLLREVVNIDEKEAHTAQLVARNTLRELARAKEEFSFTIIEDMNDYTRAGDEIVVDAAPFIVLSAEHSVKKGVHYVDLTARRA
jgi:hypothetical protein